MIKNTLFSLFELRKDTMEVERVRGEEPRPGYRITLRPKNRSAWS